MVNIEVEVFHTCSMDSPELNSYISHMAKELKLCMCDSSSNTVDSKPFHSNLAQVLTEKSKAADVKSITIPLCPNCFEKDSDAQQKIVGQIQQALLNSMKKTGVKLDGVSPPATLEELRPSVDGDFIIMCDAKYLKRNAKGETPLHTAARKKDLESVITMLKNNVNPNTQDNAGWTPLHEAVFDDNLEITAKLLAAGAIVNVPGYDFTTPLHIATHHNNFPMVQLLLKFGADPLARDISGRCPEFYAKTADIISSLKEYSSSTEMIVNAKLFQKTAAPRPIVIFLHLCHSNYDENQQHRWEAELNVRFAKHIDKSVTHVIVDHKENNVCEQTFEVLKAILFGCVIVNSNWLLACDSVGKLVSFSDYEVNGTTRFATANGPRKARNNFLNMLPPLFTGFHIFIKKDALSYTKDLVLASGAKLLNREPNPEHAPENYYLYHCPPGHSMENTATIILYEIEPKLKYNMKHIRSLSVEWFWNCIETFSIEEPEVSEGS